MLLKQNQNRNRQNQSYCLNCLCGPIKNVPIPQNLGNEPMAGWLASWVCVSDGSEDVLAVKAQEDPVGVLSS